MLQVQISQIDNGFLVAIPPRPSTKSEGGQSQAFLIYCEDYTEVCNVLRKYWPSDINK